MKKLFLAIAAVATLLASCSKDDAVLDSPAASGEQVVTFEVSSPELDTRYGEGEEATTLEWFVYEGALPTGPFVSANSMPKLVQGLGGTTTFYNKKAVVSIKFIQGRTYHVLFWAHHPGVSSSGALSTSNTVYHVNPNDATMTVDYTKLTANKEIYDAFYKFHTVGLVSSSTEGGTVYLTRPFAQLNIATSDTADAQKADLDVKYTGIGVAKAYTKLNFIDGSVSEPMSVTFNVAEKATGTYTYNGTVYDIISMNYLLIKNEKELVDVKLKLQEENGANAEVLDRAYSQIRVQRNHRTYILGDIYTQPATFTVVIKPDFDDPTYYEEEQ